MDKIKSNGVHNEYTGEDWYYMLVSGMEFVDTEDHAKPTIKVRSFKDCTLMLNRVKYDDVNSLLDLGDDKLLLDNLIIADWQVVSVIPKPGNLRMRNAFKVPFFDYEKFPYVIFGNGSHLLNLQDKSIQILVKADCTSGFCI